MLHGKYIPWKFLSSQYIYMLIIDIFQMDIKLVKLICIQKIH